MATHEKLSGMQSVRLDDEATSILEALTKHTKWNKSDFIRWLLKNKWRDAADAATASETDKAYVEVEQYFQNSKSKS